MSLSTFPAVKHRSGKSLMIMVIYACLVTAQASFVIWFIWNVATAYQRGVELEEKSKYAWEQAFLAYASGNLTLLDVDIRGELRTGDSELVRTEVAMMQQDIETMKSEGVSPGAYQNFWNSYRKALAPLSSIQNSSRSFATGLNLKLRFTHAGMAAAELNENAHDPDEFMRLKEKLENLDDLIAGREFASIPLHELESFASIADEASEKLLKFSYNSLVLSD